MPKKASKTSKKTKKAKPTKKIESPKRKIEIEEDEEITSKELIKEEPGVRMKVCEICGDESIDVVACRACGIHFCGECGYTEKHLCFNCGDTEEETQEDEVDESFVESTEASEEETEGLEEE